MLSGVPVGAACEHVAFLRFVSGARRKQVGRGVRGDSRSTRASAAWLHTRPRF
jgi:hypothetical protein